MDTPLSQGPCGLPQSLAPGSEALRSLFPAVTTHCFLNSASASPMPLTAVEAEAAHCRERALSASMRWPQWQERIAEVRGLIAAFIGAQDHAGAAGSAGERIAFTANTSSGVNLVAGGLDWRPGDEVIVGRPDFPSNVYPWRRLEEQGVQVRWLERDGQGRFTPEQCRALMTPRTRLAAISTVDYATGFAADLAGMGQLCRERGALLFVDAIQSLGALPMDVERFGVHFLACGCHKWLLGPMGLGFLYVAAEAMERISPVLVGWRSVRDEDDFSLREDVRGALKPCAMALEPGTLNVGGICSLGASLELLERVGIDAIHAHVLELTRFGREEALRRGWDVVTPEADAERSGIVSVAVPGDATQLFFALLRQNVLLSARGGRVRLSPHCFNTLEDMAAGFSALDALLP